MSAESRCSFCLRLPERTQRQRGTSAHCPICRGDLLITGDGSKYRCDASEPIPDRHGTWRVWVMGGATAVVLAALLWQLLPAHHHLPATTTEPVAQAGKEIPEQPRLSVAENTPTWESPGVAPQRSAVVAAESVPAPVAPGAVKSRPRRIVAVAKPMVLPSKSPAPAITASEPAAPTLWTRNWTEEQLQQQLHRVPEVALLNYILPPKGGNALAERKGRFTLEQLAPLVKEHKDKLLEHLLSQRAELADLPLLRGSQCQLKGPLAQELQMASSGLRRMLAEVLDRSRNTRDSKKVEDHKDSGFGLSYQLGKSPVLREPSALPALEQILTGEVAAIRLALVRHVRYPADSKSATAIVVRRALFDTSPTVRQEAIGVLRWLRSKDYLPQLLKGFQHPWAPANYHAAQALVALNAEPAIPELVKVLEAPDPAAPVEVERNGKMVPARRELVRINHNANCLLCHAPSQGRTDLVRAPVPSPSQELPPRFSQVYYEGRQSASGIFVRADITYLRQDFSEVQTVENPGKWPKQQRFDFLVRTRPLTQEEATAWQQRDQLVGPRPLPAAREAALLALRELSGMDGGVTAASWRKALSVRPQLTAAK